MGLGATSLATVMQMVANGYGVTLVPQIAADVEVRDQRVKLQRFAEPQPGRAIGLAWRRTSPRKEDFEALGRIVREVVAPAAAGATSSASVAHNERAAARPPFCLHVPAGRRMRNRNYSPPAAPQFSRG